MTRATRPSCVGSAACLALSVALWTAPLDAQDADYEHSGTATVFQNGVTIHSTVDSTYDCLLGNNWGYGGFQQGKGEASRVAIFSFWDANSEKTTLMSYAANLQVDRIGRFGDSVNLEGTGFQMLFKYPWHEDRPYRAAYRMFQDPDGKHLHASAFYLDEQEGTWHHAGTFSIRTNGKGLDSPYMFNENYGGTYGDRDLTFANAWWYTSNGKWSELTKVTTINSPCSANDRSNVHATAAGIEVHSARDIATADCNDSVTLAYTPKPSEAPIAIPYHLSCGTSSTVSVDSDAEGLAHLTRDIGEFEVDGYYQGGTAGSSAGMVDVSAAHAAPAAVYASYRSGDSFSYTLSGLTAEAAHVVRLHFNEADSSSAGQRLFDVSVNGTKLLSSFDVFANAGGAHIALVRELSASTDAQGRIVLAFDKAAGSKSGAFVNAIEAFAGTGSSDAPDGGLASIDAGSADTTDASTASASDASASTTATPLANGHDASAAVGQADAGTPAADPSEHDDAGGCSCATTHASPKGGGASLDLAIVLGLAALMRRRKQQAER